MHEFILGGARSGKSRCAEGRAAAWLAAPGRGATLLATALAGDDEMRARIDRHRADRQRPEPAAERPALALLTTIEVPLDLPQAIKSQSTPERLLVVDCLTLWLTNLLMPLTGAPLADAQARQDALLQALASAPGPVLLVSNEIGQGVMPMSAEARAFVDTLGRLHQRVAAACGRVTLMVAGIEVPVKGLR